MSIKRWLREKLRHWLLSAEERALPGQVNDNAHRIDAAENRWQDMNQRTADLEADWSRVRKALDHAEIVKEHQMESADILVLLGEQHYVEGATISDGIYVGGGNHAINNTTVTDGPTDDELAALAHRLWCHWSYNIAQEEEIGPERLARWHSLWKPYSALSQDAKETDRELVQRFMGGEDPEVYEENVGTNLIERLKERGLLGEDND